MAEVHGATGSKSLGAPWPEFETERPQQTGAARLNALNGKIGALDWAGGCELET